MTQNKFLLSAALGHPELAWLRPAHIIRQVCQ